MDHLREAFDKVKQDISSLKQELGFLRNALVDTRNEMIDICTILQNLLQKTEKIQKEQESLASTHKPENQTVSTHPSTHPTPFKPLKPQILPISTGNGGVPTDRQTDRQTDQHIVIPPKIPIKPEKPTFEQASEILETLDNIKKEIRLKFKRLTPQEMLIFSTLYQLEQTQKEVNYKDISLKLNLSESSIRDYVSRLINKGIPVEKIRKNNKQIILKISEDLRKIASLQTIIQLRDL